MLDNTLKEMADKAVEAFTTGYVQLEPINPLSQATGGVAASDWQIIQEINQDKAIIQELNISAKTDVAASEGHCESKKVRVWSVDTMTIKETIEALRMLGYHLSSDHNDNHGQSVCDRAIELLHSPIEGQEE